jgi:hypothetical protein
LKISFRKRVLQKISNDSLREKILEIFFSFLKKYNLCQSCQGTGDIATRENPTCTKIMLVMKCTGEDAQ